MTSERSKTIDAVAFAAADLVTPITVVRAAGAYLLTELSETDRRRWEVTQALGSLAAAQKSIEAAAQTLLHAVTVDAEMEAQTVSVDPWARPVVAKADHPFMPMVHDDHEQCFKCELGRDAHSEEFRF